MFPVLLPSCLISLTDMKKDGTPPLFHIEAAISGFYEGRRVLGAKRSAWTWKPITRPRGCAVSLRITSGSVEKVSYEMLNTAIETLDPVLLQFKTYPHV